MLWEYLSKHKQSSDKDEKQESSDKDDKQESMEIKSDKDISISEEELLNIVNVYFNKTFYPYFNRVFHM